MTRMLRAMMLLQRWLTSSKLSVKSVSLVHHAPHSTLPSVSSRGKKVDVDSPNFQNSSVSTNDSLTSFTRKVRVSFVAASTMVRITCTRESDAMLFAKSYGRQGRPVRRPIRSRPSVFTTKSLQCTGCWNSPSKN